MSFISRRHSRVTSTGRSVLASKRQFRRMHDLPYGIWTCEDGREVLFNRFYEPILQRRPGGPVEPATPGEWVRWKRQSWFYDDGTKDKVGAAEAALQAWTDQ